MANSAHHKIPEESRELIESAINVLKSPLAALCEEDVVLMVYNLGRMDGRIEQLDLDEEMTREALGI